VIVSVLCTEQMKRYDMDKVEIICTLIGAIAIILSGVWFICFVLSLPLRDLYLKEIGLK
jgi:hypothetical protein